MWVFDSSHNFRSDRESTVSSALQQIGCDAISTGIYWLPGNDSPRPYYQVPRCLCGDDGILTAATSRSPPLELVNGAAHAEAAAIEHVRVDHRRAHVGVSEQFLHRANVVAILEQVGRE